MDFAVYLIAFQTLYQFILETFEDECGEWRELKTINVFIVAVRKILIGFSVN